MRAWVHNPEQKVKKLASGKADDASLMITPLLARWRSVGSMQAMTPSPPSQAEHHSPSGGPRPLWWRLWRGVCHELRRLIIHQPLRGGTVALVIAVIWLLVASLGWLVLTYLSQDSFAPIKPRMIQSLLGLGFFALLWLIAFSNAIVVWGSLFHNPAARFQACLPIHSRGLYWGAFVEGGLWSSWAAIAVAVPVLAVLASQAVMPLAYGLAAAVSAGAFLLLALSLGAWAAVSLPGPLLWLRRHLVSAGLLGGIIAAILGSAALLEFGGRSPSVGFLRQAIAAISFTESPFLPSAWAQTAITAALDGHWLGWAQHSALLLICAMAIALMGEWSCERSYRRHLDALSTRPGRVRRHRAQRNLWPLLPGIPPAWALLIAKDVRLFRRDPAQVLQFALYFGLLSMYIALLPRFDHSFQFDDRWRPVVGLLNLVAVAMALATFTGRFVFPLLAQEGKRMWILVLAPWPGTTIVTAKWLFAILAGLPISLILVSLSGTMLDLPGRLIALQGLVVCGIAMGCSASALGMGALFADQREDDAGKLAAGYGGTVNLLLSLILISLLIAGAAYAIFSIHPQRYALASIWTVGVSALWTWLGLQAAWRRFAQG
ncbi:MAG: hypothetical protein EA401_03245 [Planctomycetota bacterium]|nr:MAG: hypothetical protein EA401_03245 [Planctomycetota bacterium]